MLHKAEDKRRLANRIQEHLERSPEVRPFPVAVTRLMAACHDANASSQTFETIIQCDASLSVKTLRLANSPMFSPCGDIKSVAHAVSLLGLRKLRSVAMSVAGAAMFSSGERAAEERQALWKHSIGCAAVARTLAKTAPDVDADDAFLGGVFHDIGKLLFYDAIPEEYAEIASSYSGAQLIEEEKFLFGTTHEEIGITSAKSWRLSHEILSAIGWHHRPDESPYAPEYAALIGQADHLAKFWGVGSEPAIDADNDTQSLSDTMGLQGDPDEIEAEARNAFHELTAAS